MKPHRILIFVALMFAALESYADQEHFYNTIYGHHFAVDSSVTVADDKYMTALWTTIEKNLSCTDVVTLRLNEDTSLFLNAPHTCTVDVEIYYYTAIGGEDSLTKSLTVHFDTTNGKPFNFRTSFKFIGGYKVTTKILAVYYDSVISTSYPEVFALDEDIYIDRIYKFNCSPASIFHSVDYPDQIASIDWVPVTGADEYDLEWTFYDSLSTMVRLDFPSMATYYNFDFIFKNNATRVTVPGNSYNFRLVYNPGYIMYRVRPVHYDTLNRRIEGQWTSELLTSVSVGTFASANGFSWGGHERTLNWQYNAAFAEDGKIKEATSYFDGTLRNRQSVTINNSEQKAIVGETMYDYNGRPAVITIPAPIDSFKLIYYNKFNLDPMDSEYNRKDFDTGSCGLPPAPMDSVNPSSMIPRGSSGYFSSSNPDLNTGFNNFVPDAQGYPFAQVQYTPDNTGRILKQSIPGKTHYLGSGHEVQYYYGKPAQVELDRLFGSEVGNQEHYMENMVIDPNGQISITYIDANGKTIATALAGNPPANVQALPSYVPQTTINVNLLAAETNPSPTSTQSSYSLLATNSGTYKFAYKLFPNNYIGNCNNNCYNCFYDISLRITSVCGSTPIDTIRYDSNYTFSQLSSMGCLDSNLVDTFSLYLEPGEYEISRTITVDQNEIDSNVNRFLKDDTCLQSYQSFLDSAIAHTDFSGCDMNCQTCLASLGTQANFLTKYINQLISAKITITTEDTVAADSMYSIAVIHCNQLCVPPNPCGGLYNVLLADVSPGGQYCLYDTTGGIYTPGDTASMLYGDYRHPNPPYKDANGNLDSVVIASVKYSPEALTITDFVKNWQPTWDSSLVQYHPEYCYYKYCQMDTASNRFDADMENTSTFAAALAAGLINPLGDSSEVYTINWKDPYFRGTLGYTMLHWMLTHTEIYQVVGTHNFSLWDIAATAMTDMSDTLQNLSIPNTASTFGSGCTGDLNMEWVIFRGMYLGMKQHIQDSLENYWVAHVGTCSIYAECIGTNNAPCGSSVYASKTARNVTPSSAVNPMLQTWTSPSQAQHAIDSAMAAACDTQCASYAYAWLQELNGCGTISTAQADSLIAGFKEVCEIGCNPNHPSGSSTTPGLLPDSRGDRDFEDVIIRVLGVSDSNAPCNAIDIPMPPPYYDSTGLMGPPVTYYRPTGSNACICGTLNELYTTDFQPDSIAHDTATAKGFAHYLNDHFGGNMADSTITELMSLCNDTSCFFLPYPVQLPLWLTCCEGDTIPSSNAINTNPYGWNWLREDTLGSMCSLDSTGGRTWATGFSVGHYAFVGTGYGDYANIAPNTAGLQDFWKWNQRNNTWTSIANVPGGHRLGAIGFSIGAYGYVGLGEHDSIVSITTDSLYNDLWRYDTTANTWTAMANFPDSGRAGAFSFVLGNKAYVGAGIRFPLWNRLYTDTGYNGRCLTHFWEYNPATNTWTQLADFPGGPRAFLGAFALGGYGYAGCGIDNSKTAHNDMWRYNPSSNTWDTIPRIPNNDTGLMGPVGFTMYGHGIIGTGDYLTATYNPFWQYNAVTNSWASVPELNAWQPVYYGAPQHFSRYYGVGLNIGNEGYCGFGSIDPEYCTTFARIVLEGYFHDFWQFSAGIDSVPPLVSPQCCISCKQIDSAVVMFDSLFPSLYDTTYEYKNLLANYLNNFFGFTLTYTQYEQFYSECDTGHFTHDHIPPLLCNEPLNNSVAPDTNNCVSQLLYTAQANAKNAYSQYLDSVTNNFEAAYIAHCMNIDDSFNVNAPFDEYHYTLYYYDQAENLVKTIPPKGVYPITSLASLDSVTKNRAGVGGYNPVYPYSDSLATRYWYNTLNSPITQFTPDGDSVYYFYDRLNRLVLSQNAVQRPYLYSYTLYDKIGRVNEVGQLNDAYIYLPNPDSATLVLSQSRIPIDTLNKIARNPNRLAGLIAITKHTQITHIFYDTVAVKHIPVAQQELRKRISTVTYKDTETYNDTIYDNAIHFSYDINGNVQTYLTDNTHEMMVGQQYKRTEYDYDLVSGNINEIYYQRDSIDQFLHKYEYDADNLLTNVLTSQDSIYWEQDADYEYYTHGPLAREVIGRRQVQGVDFAYTLNGWLTGINSSITSASDDMGADGNVHYANNLVARDAYGFTLNYFNGDYRPIGASNMEAKGLPVTSLYNGNIAGATYSIKPLNPHTLGWVYKYDQLNRYVGQQAYNGIDTVHNNWATGSPIPDFLEKATYDENGNILTYLRHGNTIASMPVAMDSLNYNYKTGTNQLAQVLDAVPATNYPNDIHNETSNRNYQYNAIGQLAKDSAGKIDTIIWNVYGKVKEIIMQSPSSTIHKDSILFDYDPFGNRLEKRSYKTLLTCMSCLPMLSADTTIYARNGHGRILAVYDRSHKEVHLTEWDIYGLKRIGVVDTDLIIYGLRPIVTDDTTILDSSTISYLEGQKQYELANHLGNVLVTVSDKKIPVDTNFDMLADYYQPNIITAQDYYPFGMVEPGRQYAILHDSSYHYGFNGMMKDNDIYGTGNAYTTDFREVDPRLGGRWWSPDRISRPNFSIYAGYGDNPIIKIDPRGDDDFFDNNGNYLFSTPVGNTIRITSVNIEAMASYGVPDYISIAVENSAPLNNGYYNVGLNTMIINISKYYEGKLDGAQQKADYGGFGNDNFAMMHTSLLPDNKIYVDLSTTNNGTTGQLREDDLADANNFKNDLAHERVHYFQQLYNTNVGKTDAQIELEAYMVQVTDNSWGATTEHFKGTIKQNIADYLQTIYWEDKTKNKSEYNGLKNQFEKALGGKFSPDKNGNLHFKGKDKAKKAAPKSDNNYKSRASF